MIGVLRTSAVALVALLVATGPWLCLAEGVSPGGVQQGAELFLPLAPPFEGTGLAANSAGTVFTHLLASGAMEELLISLTPSTPAATLATFALTGPEPTDLTVDSSGNLALLMRDSLLMQHFVDRRDTTGTLLGSDGPLPGGGGLGPARVAPGTGGDVFALVDDSLGTNREIYRVEIGQAPVPIAAFPSAGPRIPVDLSADASGNVLVLIQEQLLNQGVVERLDPTGALLEIAAAAPSASFGNDGRVESAVDGSLYLLSTSLGGAMGRELQRSFELVDSDLDGILDDGNVSGLTNDAPCSGGNLTGCDDNCTFAANATQLDSGGVGSPVDPFGQLRDEIGDACQCGDVNATGTVIADDAVDLRLDLADALPGGDVAQPDFCNVIGPANPSDGPDANNLPDDCNIADAAVLTRQLFGLGPGPAEVCGPAVL